MIGRLSGILAAKRAPQVLIDCHGVGYEADVSMTTFYQLPETGESVSIWTHLVIKDDAHNLIGFNSEPERALFRQLIKVNGVGPKMALTILSGIDEQQFAQCINNNDVAMLTRLPGVGKKTAERLIIEMRDKVADLVGVATSPQQDVSRRSIVNEAIEALQALGYKAGEAENLVQKAQQGEAGESSVSALIKMALQSSARS
ncbi:MAG: Holliday junction DNA helicase RuvA [Planctomycetota bacterium]|jgi:Holliday junction DNA helicase RuvA